MSYPHFAADCGEHHDLVRDFTGPRPTITVLCGSTRYPATFAEQNLRLTLAGHIVLTIGCNLRSTADLAAAIEADTDLDAVKAELDDLHKRKIDLADEVLVLNVDGYVGESTGSEIEYARAHGKPVRFLVEAGEVRAS